MEVWASQVCLMSAEWLDSGTVTLEEKAAVIVPRAGLGQE